MERKNGPDYIALGCAVFYLLCFCLLPFYGLFALSGWMVMRYVNAVLCLALALGVLMGVCCLFVDERVSIGIGVAAFLVTLIFLLAGGSIVVNGRLSTQIVNGIASKYIGVDLDAALPVSFGAGGLICLLTSLLFVGLEIYWATKGKKRIDIDREGSSGFVNPYSSDPDDGFISGSISGTSNDKNDWSI